MLLLMLDRYRDRVFWWVTDFKNSFTHVPRRGDCDPERFQRSSKVCAWGLWLAQGQQLSAILLFSAPVDLLRFCHVRLVASVAHSL
jgi:hypothetical protein